MKSFIKTIITYLGIKSYFLNIIQKFSSLSIKLSLSECKLNELFYKLYDIVPNISDQIESEKETFNEYWELKRRALQAFQCQLMLKMLNLFFPPYKNTLTVVDIGDSAGTHMKYLQELTKGKYEIETISVNLDPRAIDKIKAKGQKAILCRAEDLDLGDKEIDFFTSFECIEHLHNPALFFHRIARKSKCNKFLMTVPYVRTSRVGLHYIRDKNKKKVFAENVHIFELSPEDWELLIYHSGWNVVCKEIYCQYPKKIPLISTLLSYFWRITDFEGFLGLILEKDNTYSDLYQDWED